MPGLTAIKPLIVYIDDDADDLELIQTTFASYADLLILKLFNNSVEGYRYLKSLRFTESLPSLILLDMNMPAMSGREILTELREMIEFHHTSIVLFTTSNSAIDAQFAKDYEAGFVTKPVSAAQLKELAKTLVSYCSEEVRNKLCK